MIFKKRKSISIYSLPLLLSLCLICLSRYCCSVFLLSPDMSSFSLPVLVLLTMLWGNILAYNFIIICVVSFLCRTCENMLAPLAPSFSTSVDRWA